MMYPDIILRLVSNTGVCLSHYHLTGLNILEVSV